jgi:hypothetical protein
MRARWRLDRRLTAMMIEDFIHDPILATKVILDWDLPPHQKIRLLEMWTTHLTIDDSGFSTGKTATFSIVIALRSILFSGRISGIVSGTFRQSQLIFEYFDRWYNSSPIFRYCVRHARGQPKIIHGTSAWSIQFKGGSVARALPAGFLSDVSKDKSRLRSERWHDGYFDEWVTFDPQVLTRTLFGRVTAVNREQNDPIRQNHIHLASTPGFTSYPSYAIVSEVDKQIEKRNRNYARFTSNYRHIPNTKKWIGFVDRRTIHTMQTTNPLGVVKSEIDGIWQSDSMSFYSYNNITSCRYQNCPIMFKRKEQEEIFIAGFDSARGGLTKEKQLSGQGDDFALTVLKINTNPIDVQHVLTVRKNNIRAAQMAAIVYNYDCAFNFKYIVYDPGGGGAFVVDELQGDFIVIDGKNVEISPITDVFDYSNPHAKPALVPFKRGHQLIELAFGKTNSDSVIINKLHVYVSALIENKKIKLAGRWDGWPVHYGISNISEMRRFLNSNAQNMDKQTVAKAEMDLAVLQLTSVDIERKNGVPVVDSHGMFKFASRYKKDAAYSIIYSACGFMIYEQCLERDRREGSEKLTISVGTY